MMDTLGAVVFDWLDERSRPLQVEGREGTGDLRTRIAVAVQDRKLGCVMRGLVDQLAARVGTAQFHEDSAGLCDGCGSIGLIQSAGPDGRLFGECHGLGGVGCSEPIGQLLHDPLATRVMLHIQERQRPRHPFRSALWPEPGAPGRRTDGRAGPTTRARAPDRSGP